MVEDFGTYKRIWEFKTTRNGGEAKEERVKDVYGKVLSKSSEVCERWKKYFDGLLNVKVSGRAEIIARPGMNVRRFEKESMDVSIKEVCGTISRLVGREASVWME